ncbi:hypothetical protein EJ08DRAFT_594130 [Tothia fuscella]|uniref:Zn(2)-C6 fungal-type domain-containing protein n=1 Tax=Tothia fuscella TaxID=1048955 RepID=A0A9P4NL15_9PEZI|nr:hypothetical protein EJ08DRAFT_594130 [Tothia fuscella]
MENPRDNTPSIIIAAGRKHAKAHGVAEESDYSSSVRKKLSTSSRTGQACDRCKIRKIRCDSAVGGCSPCRQTQATCKTTDRITGKATVRGLTDILEGENRYLKTKLREMQQQMRDLGIQVEDDGDSSQYASQSQLQPREEPRWDLPHQHNSSRRNTHAIIEIPQENTSLFRRHIANETGSLSQDPGFSLLRGTKLALFGMQIDLAEFADDISEVDSPATYEGFMEQIFNRTPPNDPAPLPPNLQAAKEYMQWYLRFLNPYTPILHKSDINELLAKFYEDPTPGPRPGRPAAEEVVVHMMFSLIKYQYGQRNKIQSMIDEAMAHFQYCLKFWPDLVKSQTLQDVQAMTLISLQIRSFPKPGAAWYCGTMALTTAIEIGMNRSAAAWSALDPRPMTVHEMEMRKRIFWTLYTLVIGLSGRLGRPMPLRLSDIDIEFPQPINDNLPEEGSIAEFRQCSFHVGIAIDKILALSGELYSTFYSVSGCRPEKYDANIARFEADLASFRSSIHPELQDSRRAEGEVKIFALYIELYALETEFLLRHPLIMHSNDGERFKEQLICAREHVPKTLRVLRILRDANCLDVPWFTVTTFLAMIFTTLFAENQRREEITDGELEKLKGEMDGWLNILGDIGIMLGESSFLALHIRSVN